MKVQILYFSGTGNTEAVSGLLERAFENEGVDVERIRIEDVLKEKAQLDVESCDLLGLAHPIYGCDTPRIVYDFIEHLPPTEVKRSFILKTAGDFVSVNEGSSWTAIRRLKRKGYDVFYDRIICMSPNWVLKYNDRLIKQLYEAAVCKTAHMCEEILAGKERRLGSVAAGLVSRMGYLGEDLGARFFGRDLHVTSGCIDCDRCIDSCPTSNIHRKDGTITFGWDCIWCMRCIYACPRGAIVPRLSKFCVIKDGYDVARVLADPDVQGDYVTEETRGYFRHFIRYLQQVEV